MLGYYVNNDYVAWITLIMKAGKQWNEQFINFEKRKDEL
jgi:hypothetical protein